MEITHGRTGKQRSKEVAVPLQFLVNGSHYYPKCSVIPVRIPFLIICLIKFDPDDKTPTTCGWNSLGVCHQITYFFFRIILLVA
jgi:hypothetical protein